MTLEDLISLRDALLEELKLVREDIKRAKAIAAAQAASAKTAGTIYGRGREALAMRRNGMTYKAIAKAIGSSSPGYTRRIVHLAAWNEKEDMECHLPRELINWRRGL